MQSHFTVFEGKTSPQKRKVFKLGFTSINTGLIDLNIYKSIKKSKAIGIKIIPKLNRIQRKQKKYTIV